MTRVSSDMFILPGAVEGAEIGSDFGKLTLDWDESGEPEPFDLLDCFDRSVRKSGRLLIETGGRLMLLGADGAILEQAAARDGNFVADLADGPVKSALAELSPLRCLMVLGRGAYRQRRAALVDDERKTQARTVFKTLEPAGDGNGVTVVSVHGLRGYDKAYDLLADRLRNAAAGLEIGDIYQVLFPGIAGYDAKPDIAITTEETAFQTANDIVAAYIAVARRNEPGVIADLDTEFLHDYRVALRKVRSVISLFKGVYDDAQTLALKQAFSDLMAPTGRMRDLDVYLLDRQHYFDLLPGILHDGLTVMFGMFEKERNAQLAALTRRFKSKSYRAEMKRLSSLFATPEQLVPGPNAARPAHDYACALIWKRYRKVCKIAAAIDDNTEDEEVHELRIHCKKLRYLMEFFSPLFPSNEFRSLIKPLKRLQDNLGLFNDYSVQQVSLQAFLDGHASKGRKKDLAIAKSIGALIAVLHHRQLEERAKVVASFAHFDSPDVQQKFRHLFHAEGQ